MRPEKLRVAFIAMACAPGHTSESGLAWQAILALHNSCELTVITHESHRNQIEIYNKASTNVLANVNFEFLGQEIKHHPNQLLARLFIWKHYRDWMAMVNDYLADQSESEKFDLCHHVTYSTWRLGSPFWKSGLPTIWGPIGGAGRVPLNCMRSMSRSGILSESLRTILSYIYRYSKSFRLSLKHNTLVLASNKETEKFLKIAGKEDIKIVFPTWFSVPDESSNRANDSHRQTIRCFTGGGIIASKGICYTLEAIHALIKSGTNIEFQIAGYGPEKPHLQRMIVRLGLTHHVRFLPLLSGEEYRRTLSEADLFLFPSFRENIGMTMVEAMLFEQAPIVLDRSAPSEIVTNECGWVIDSSTPQSIISGISDAITEAVNNPQLLLEKQQYARKRIAQEYSLEKYRNNILSAYSEATSKTDTRKAFQGEV